MKKVFAFLSTLLLTIAFVGIFAVSKPAAASNKITEDPTLAKDEIPVYIMNSIYTTFPNYYDNDAVEDANWPGPARMYPWNETRLRVAQLNEDGTPTGKYYAVYFSGHTVAVNADGSLVVGAGKNILFWNVDANGNVVAEKYSDGKKAASGNASDPSLSHMRTNISGQDIEFVPTTLGMGDEGTNFYNRSIVFDAEGRIIRAIGLDGIYDNSVGDYKMAPEYCYVDGVVTKMEEGVECDKLLKAEEDENGEPVLDENGEPVYTETDEDNILYSRFVYEYFTEKPEVNEVPYLSEGWDPHKWDYCYPEGDGYLCIAFVRGANNSAALNDAQIAAYKKTLIADGVSEEEAATQAAAAVRNCVASLRIPAGGYTFDYGYLDRGTGNDVFFNDTVIKGYKYGRQMLQAYDRECNAIDGEQVGMGEQRTYDFSVTGIYFMDKVINGSSYQLLDGQNVVEVMQGETVKPAQSINYNGVMRYWATQDDLTSYTASAEALNFYVTESVNGGSAMTVVQPPQGYTSLDQIKDEFLADVAKHKGVAVEDIPFDSAANWHSFWSWGSFFATNADNGKKPDYPSAEAPAFWNVPANRDKWLWLVERIYATMLAYPGGDSYTASLSHVENAMKQNYAGSPETINKSFYYFLNGEAHTYFGFNFSDADGNGVVDSAEWIDAAPSKEKWDAYTLDASMKAPNENWVVTYKVENAVTGVSSETTVKYVVVDSYTPIIKVDANKLFYTPKVISDLVVCDPIDPYEIVKAYDASYNGVDILGNNISQNIEFDTELDFANPKEGNWPVVATIYNNAGTKKAVAEFVIRITDITAPNAVTRKVYVQQGADFDVRSGIVLAVDNVDGDLSKQAYTWWQEDSKPVDTTKVKGESANYTIKVTIFDKAGNERQVSYTLVVVADKFSDDTNEKIEEINTNISDLVASIDDIISTQAELGDKVAELQAVVNELSGLKAEIAELKAAIAGVKTDVENVQAGLADLEGNVEELVEVAENAAKGCKKNSTALVLEIAGAAALLAFVLRKRH